jgi:hypothetical protein
MKHILCKFYFYKYQRNVSGHCHKDLGSVRQTYDAMKSKQAIYTSFRDL